MFIKNIYRCLVESCSRAKNNNIFYNLAYICYQPKFLFTSSSKIQTNTWFYYYLSVYSCVLWQQRVVALSIQWSLFYLRLLLVRYNLLVPKWTGLRSDVSTFLNSYYRQHHLENQFYFHVKRINYHCLNEAINVELMNFVEVYVNWTYFTNYTLTSIINSLIVDYSSSESSLHCNMNLYF